MIADSQLDPVMESSCMHASAGPHESLTVRRRDGGGAHHVRTPPREALESDILGSLLPVLMAPKPHFSKNDD